MAQRLILTPQQKIIFHRLSQRKVIDEIARELHITSNAVKDKVRSVLCICGFKNINKVLTKKKYPTELLN